MISENEIRKNSFSGLKTKLLISLFLTNIAISIVTLFFIYLFGSGQLKLFKYLLIMSISLIIAQVYIYYYINKLQKKSFMVGILFQNYIERSQSTINEFIYPKKNITNSFNKQFDFTNQTSASIAPDFVGHSLFG